MHVIIWRFRARPGREAEFERAYGPAGDWVKLFRRFSGYVGTELLRSAEGDYVTLDRWVSAAAYDAFHGAGGEEYRRLDVACEGLTAHEEAVGRYDAL